jgi:ABC-2 type transport system ATP-binding protein/lipopolysaccharide transport system ATP-binding protein
MTSIRIQNVSVQLPIYDANSLRLIRLPSFRTARVGTQTVSHAGNVVLIHALNDIDLELADGDRVCLIGHNGAGKTTLLRVIAGIIPATSGLVEVNGSVYSLLSGMVMNADATGYENIRLAANLHRWPKTKLGDYIKDIEEFTELGEYLSLPTRVYSAGMQARLGFAIATTQSPDILLIDEGIGAGDAHFRDKAQQRVQQFVSGARIIVLASHSQDLCKAICTKAVLMAKGRKVFFGDLDEGFQRYAETT